MRQFVDALGREWTVDLNIGTAREIRGHMRGVETLKDVDFLDYASLVSALNDVFFAADLLFVVCRVQADERGVDEPDFGRALKGTILFDAREAFLEEYVDFFPDPTTREKIKEIVGKNKEVQERIEELILKNTTAALDEVRERVETTAGEAFSTALPQLAAASESTKG